MTQSKQFLSNRIYHFVIIAFLTFLASCAPETEVVPDYSGSWTCAETATNPAGTSTYTVTLKKVGTSETDYKITNFYRLGASYECAATLTASSVTIAQQTIGSGATAYSVSGSGTITSSTKISLSYKADDGSGSAGIDNCTANLTKQ